MTQEIIVYRNPLEKAVWDLLSDSTTWSALASTFIGGMVFLAILTAFVRLSPRNNRDCLLFRGVMLGSGVLGAIIAWKFFCWMS